MPKIIKINEHGRRIGESHPRASMTDHEVQLLMRLLEEREALLDLYKDQPLSAILAALKSAGLSFRLLALKFEISKCHVAKIARGERRCQTAVVIRACP